MLTNRIFAFFLCLITAPCFGQLQDACFFSVWTGPNFESSDNLSNCTSSKADMVKYEGGAWTGLDPAVVNNVTIAPPVACDGIKCVWLRVGAGATIGQGIGFRLDDALANGDNVTIQLTYVSHGFGSAATFQPRIYTGTEDQLFSPDGIIQGTYYSTMPAAGTTWTTNWLNINATAAQNGHDWVYFYANNSSGMLVNMCQDDIQPILWEGGTFEVEACAGQTVSIGPGGSTDLDYSWSNGGDDPMTDVTTSGWYYLSVDNNCNEVLGSYDVTFHEEPELLPIDEELIICADDSLLMTLEGWEAEAMWPDGSIGTEYWMNGEGTFDVTITDNCFTVTDQVIVDFDTIPTVDLGPDVAICEGEFYTWDVTYPGSLTTYEWQDGSTEPTYTRNWEGDVMVTLTSPCGVASDVVFLEVSEEPDDLLPSRVELCTGRKAFFDLSDIEGDFLWNTGETTNTLETQFAGNTSVTIWDDDNCWVVRDTSFIVPISCECPIWVPNAFTPDGDDLNEVFQPVFECTPYDFRLSVYDRWGRIVYEMWDSELGWDGRVDGRFLPADVYNWRLFYRETFDGIPIERYGTVFMVVDE